MLADDLTTWFEAHQVHLDRAAEAARQDLSHLIEDWAGESDWDPRVLLTLETRMEHDEHWSAAEAAEVPG